MKKLRYGLRVGVVVTLSTTLLLIYGVESWWMIQKSTAHCIGWILLNVFSLSTWYGICTYKGEPEDG